jgi:hypothetical protein
MRIRRSVLNALSEVVTDKGYHSNDTVWAVQEAQARSYLPEPKRPRRHEAGLSPRPRKCFEAAIDSRRRVQSESHLQANSGCGNATGTPQPAMLAYFRHFLVQERA